jgi:hypothetical protein
MQIEVTTVCMYGYVKRVEPDALPVEGVSHQCEMVPAFKACPETI